MLARYGIPPERVPDFIGLKGDTSDAIEGVPGIGDKTAGQLIAQFGSLENLLENIDDVSGEKRRETLRTHTEQAMRSRRPCDDAPRPAARLRPGRPRSRSARSLAPEGDLPALRVRNLLQRIDLLEEAIPSAPLKLEAWRCRGGRPSSRTFRDRQRSLFATGASRSRATTSSSATGPCRSCRHVRSAALVARLQSAAARALPCRHRGCRRHDADGVPDRAGAGDLRARRPRGRLRHRAQSRARRRRGDGCARASRRGHSSPRRARCAGIDERG